MSELSQSDYIQINAIFWEADMPDVIHVHFLKVALELWSAIGNK